MNHLRNLVLPGALLVSAGCSEAELVQPPPPPVVVAEPVVRDVQDHLVVTGTTEPLETVEVRARVQGVLLDIPYPEGLPVEEGDPMFLIDPEPFVAARDAAKAEVSAAEAAAKLADITADKLEKAFEDRAVSELQALEARAKHEVAVEQVEIALKQLAIRELDVSYTDIRAPISGRAMMSEKDVGSLVGTLGSTSLTQVVDDSKVRAIFTMPDRILLERLRARDPETTQRLDLDLLPPVRIAREGDEGFPFEGRIDYIDPEVDESTGTLRLRAVFDNQDGTLLGGLFVRVQIPKERIPQAVIVPESAVASDQQGRFVYVVEEGDVVDRREIVLGPRVEEGVVITSGVSAGDRVIVAGQLSARPGAVVAPRTREAAASDGGASAGQD